MRSGALVALVLGTTFASSSPISNADQLVLSPSSGKKPRPLVIWHGLGDTALSDGMSSFIEGVKAVHPGIFVHSVHIPPDGTLDEERRAGFYGKAEEQGEWGCEQLESIPELKGGFDGIGFSQGGLFMRYYAQYCNDPPVRNLITFGTPNFGIASLIPCPTPPSLTCLLAARAARSSVYSTWAQSHLVQAAYFRDPARFEEFLQANTFIRDLNAEGVLAEAGDGDEDEDGRKAGGLGLEGLENLVAVMFDLDHTVSPAQSAHFATYSPTNKTLLIPLQNQTMWQKDSIGLRTLDEKGGLHLEHCPGQHMDLGTGDCGMKIVRDWFGWKG